MDTATQSKRLYFFKTECPSFSNVGIVIFNSRAKLRGHVLKHLIAKKREREWDATWRHYNDQIHNEKGRDITRKQLSNLGCLGFKNDIAECGKCSFFEKECNSLMATWEEHYEKIVEKALSAAFKRPLFADYENSKIRVLDVLSTSPKVLIGCNKEQSKYTVKTAYSPEETFFQIRRNIYQKGGGKVLFCTPKTWKIQENHNPAAKESIPMKVSKPPQGRKQAETNKEDTLDEWQKALMGMKPMLPEDNK